MHDVYVLFSGRVLIVEEILEKVFGKGIVKLKNLGK